jgi:hypothetical protein
MIYFFMARAEGFEPPSTVLETAILPLNYARLLKASSIKDAAGFLNIVNKTILRFQLPDQHLLFYHLHG